MVFHKNSELPFLRPNKTKGRQEVLFSHQVRMTNSYGNSSNQINLSNSSVFWKSKFWGCLQLMVMHFKIRRTSSGGVQVFQTQAFFRYSPNCVLKFSDQFRGTSLKNQFKKRTNPSKQCTNSLLFQITSRSILKHGSHQ